MSQDSGAREFIVEREFLDALTSLGPNPIGSIRVQRIAKASSHGLKKPSEEVPDEAYRIGC